MEIRGVVADGLGLLSFKGMSGRLAGDGRGARSRGFLEDIKTDKHCQLEMVETVFLKSFFVLLCFSNFKCLNK